jgi:hypothetical protein
MLPLLQAVIMLLFAEQLLLKSSPVAPLPAV